MSDERITFERLEALPDGATKDLAKQLFEVGDAWTIAPAVRCATTTAWRPNAQFMLIDGDLEVEGNVVVATGSHDHGALIVLGSLRCQQLITGHGQNLVVTGDLIANDAIIAELADSTTHVGGMVLTDTLLSGRGAWVSLASADGFKAKHCSAYVMVGNIPLKPAAAASTVARLVDDVLDRDEWDSMDEEDRQGEDIDDLIMLDEVAALRHVAKGCGLLRG